MKSTSVNTLKARRQAKIKQLATIGPFVDGSLCTIKRRCGKPACHCAEGEGHIAYVLTKSVKGKTKTTYVPVEITDEVQEWSKQRKKLNKLIKEIGELSEQIIRLQVRTSRAVAKNKKAQSQ